MKTPTVLLTITLHGEPPDQRVCVAHHVPLTPHEERRLAAALIAHAWSLLLGEKNTDTNSHIKGAE